MANPVVEFQIVSNDPDKTARFYGDLFGWTTNTDNPMRYRRIQTGSGEGIQGGIWPAPPQAPAFAQFFVAVEDVAASAAAAEQLGAKVLIPPTTLPEGDKIAVLQDPQGLSFAVLRRA